MIFAAVFLSEIDLQFPSWDQQGVDKPVQSHAQINCGSLGRPPVQGDTREVKLEFELTVTLGKAAVEDETLNCPNK